MNDEERKALVQRIRKEASIQIGFDGIAYMMLTTWADQIEADGQRIAELEREVERRTYDGIHTCHDQRQRVACVLRRRIAELEGWKAAEEAHHHLLKRRIAELEATIREITGT